MVESEEKRDQFGRLIRRQNSYARGFTVLLLIGLCAITSVVIVGLPIVLFVPLIYPEAEIWDWMLLGGAIIAPYFVGRALPESLWQ